MGQILFRQGNIFEGSMDLTVLPCSAKGTVSSATKRWLSLFNLPEPLEIEGQGQLKLGDITKLVPFPGSKRITKYIVFAASVLNDASSAEAIEEIGKKLGNLTKNNPDIKIVESPLLGTGQGRLTTVIAGKSLSKGFKSTSVLDSYCYIFVFDQERLNLLEEELSQANVGAPIVFISHSSHDEIVATCLVELLETALFLETSDIRCTSVAGYKLPTGTHTSTQLREDIRNAIIVMGIVTPYSIRSSYVLFELGASWGLRKPTFPILAKGAGFDILPGPLYEQHSAKLDDRVDIQQMLADIASNSEIQPKSGVGTKIAKKIEDLVEAASSRK